MTLICGTCTLAYPIFYKMVAITIMATVQRESLIDQAPYRRLPRRRRRVVAQTNISTPSSSSSSMSAIGSSSSRRGIISVCTGILIFPFCTSPSSCLYAAATTITDFSELPNSGGVKALDLRFGDGQIPTDGDQVAVHYYGRLAAKQGWRFDSTYEHKDETGVPIPFVFTLGSGKVISGIEAAVRSMKVGGIRRVVIPPSQGYQNTLQEPLPPNFFDRQRLFTTIFNPTRLANGEGSTLGTLVFDIELVSTRHQ